MESPLEINESETDIPPILSLFALLYKEITDVFSINKAAGISKTQLVIMLALSTHSPLNMKQLSHFIGVPKEQATRMVANLVEKGFATRTIPETNRTHINIELTELGRNHVENVKDNLRGIFRKNMNSALSDEEKAELYRSAMTTLDLINKVVQSTI